MRMMTEQEDRSQELLFGVPRGGEQGRSPVKVLKATTQSLRNLGEDPPTQPSTFD